MKGYINPSYTVRMADEGLRFFTCDSNAPNIVTETATGFSIDYETGLQCGLITLEGPPPPAERTGLIFERAGHSVSLPFAPMPAAKELGIHATILSLGTEDLARQATRPM